MADGFPELDAFLQRQIAQISRGVSQTQREVAGEALRVVVEGTPVDVGTARSNWLVTVGNEDEDTVIPAHAPGSNLGIGEQANAQVTIDEGQKVMAASKPGQDIIIQNNVPYIETLNEGSSRQAPALFVETGVAAAIAYEPKARLVEND